MTTIIKQVLANKGMSQNRLSQEARVPASNLSQIVNGKLAPCPAWKQRISAVLDIPENILFPESR